MEPVRPRPRYSQFNVDRASGTQMPYKPGPNKRPKSQNIEPSTNVFINYIPPEFNEADLRALCAPYGKIVCSKIMINLETGQSKCFGFVRFETLSQAQAAIKELNGMVIGSKKLLAKYAQSREKKERAAMTIYIKRLPMDINEDQVTQLFSQFGDIIQITHHTLTTQDPQYWRCFVRYSSFEAAANAIAQMNNQIIVPNTRPIHVRYADESRLSGGFPHIDLPQRASIGPILPEQASEIDHKEKYLLPSFLFM